VLSQPMIGVSADASRVDPTRFLAGPAGDFRPAFRRRSTFALFVLLASGLVAQTGRRSVVGMLAGARMQAVVSFHRVCRFFSAASWDPDRLGLLCARLITERLLPPGAPVLVVVDDTLFKRWGRKVHGTFVTHDGSAQGPRKLARGNRWIIAGIVVTLPWCSHPVCLPVLFGLWAGKGTTSPVELAAQLVGLLARELPDRRVHGVVTRPTTASHWSSTTAPGRVGCRPTPRCMPRRHRGPASGAAPAPRATSSAHQPSSPPPAAGSRRGCAAMAATTPSR
jgi:hypothetical protein